MKYFTPQKVLNVFKGSAFENVNITNKEIYAIYFEGQTLIPEDSLIRFMQYNIAYFDALLEIKTIGSEEMINIKKNLLNGFYNAQSTDKEVYTRKQLSDIFGVSEKQIKQKQREEMKFKHFLLPKEIPVTDVLIYLKHHTNALKRLEDRHSTFIASTCLTEEPLIRHILMLYFYYEAHGYII